VVFGIWLIYIYRYRLEVGVKDSTNSTILVMFEEVVEQVSQLKLADQTSILENVSVKYAFTLKSYYNTYFFNQEW